MLCTIHLIRHFLFFFLEMKTDEIESEEMLLKKTERNKKRRLQAIKRREKHKVKQFKFEDTNGVIFS